tara:strand:+ start:708 stop:1178 length:471 start_codon:yes stop_codon:yes gene_type:complete
MSDSTLAQPAVQSLLGQWPVATLSTFGTHGIDTVPVVFWYNGAGQLFIPHDGKPKRPGRLQRFRNLEADPRCTLLFQHYSADWRQLWWLRVRGTGVTQSLGEGPAEGLRAKYPQYAHTELTPGNEAVRVEIRAVRLWSATSDLDVDDIGRMLECVT